MPTEVFEGIHVIDVPLPNSPLKAVNCYVIKTDDRSLLVDTGMNRPECQEPLEAGLRELGVDMAKLDVFVTHLHADHMGLASTLAQEGSMVYFNQIENDMLYGSHRKGGFGSSLGRWAKLAGFSDDELEGAISKHPGVKFHSKEPVNLTILNDGDLFEFGGFNFEVVQTPGHSPGHLCLYDRDNKMMICGDHVLAEISPNIAAWDEEENPLYDYLKSLDRVSKLDIELGLPGHRRMLNDFHERVAELQAHHAERLEEVHGILSSEPMSAYALTPHMSWNLKYKSWKEVHVMQKWFATGEALAHLRHLEKDGYVTSNIENDVMLYCAT